MNSVMPLILLVAVFLSKSTATVLTGAARKSMLDLHNNFRKLDYNKEQNLEWDDELASSADKYTAKCIFGHDTYKDRQLKRFTFVGQNIYVSSNFDMKPEDAVKESVKGWYNEKSDYNYQSNLCNPGRMCGHYTQVVWKKTTHVGCAYKSCERITNFQKGIIVICNYGPTGNFNGEKPY